jgi:hypothetical protein
MKGRWESNINVWLPFMYSKKLNCYFQNRIIMFFLRVLTHIYLREIYIFPGLVCLFCCRKYLNWSWENIKRPKTHECGNWHWGRAIPRKGIHKRDFHCSVHFAYSLGHRLKVYLYSMVAEIHWRDDSKIKRLKNSNRNHPRPMPNICHLPYPP